MFIRAILLFIAFSCPQKAYSFDIKTKEYVNNLSLKKFEMKGSDYFNSTYNPTRIGKKTKDIDRTYDYDFKRLNVIESKLNGVNRLYVLRYMFNQITKNAKTETEKHLKLLSFLQKSSYHSYFLQPMRENKQSVFDPLVLLELGEMRCGAVARIGVDLFEAAGYKTRIVQAASHVTAEVFYENDWHLIEADLIGGGLAPMKKNKIASFNDIVNEPEILDKVPSHMEVLIYFPKKNWKDTLVYNSYYFQSIKAYGNTRPLFYYKTASEKEALESPDYGWNYYKTIKDEDRNLKHNDKKLIPLPPVVQNIKIKENKVFISWKKDDSKQVAGYKIFVYSKTRGWNYQYRISSKATEHYTKLGWQPYMFDNLHKIPPSDIALIETKNNFISLKISNKQKRYISVMAYDQYGADIGRTVFPMSEEFVFSPKKKRHI